MKKVLNASIARIVLSLLLLIILSAMVGLVIFAYSFLSKTSASAKTATSSKQTSTSPAGVKSTFVSIQLGDHIDYTKFLHFLSLIEKNVTRMQLSGVSISRGANNHEISIQSLEVKVYTR